MQSLGKDVDGDGGLEGKEPAAREEAQAPNAIVDRGDKVIQQDERGRTSVGCPRKGLSTKTLEKDIGRLVIEEGRSRYVSNTFWASLSDEVSGMAFGPYIYHMHNADTAMIV